MWDFHESWLVVAPVFRVCMRVWITFVSCVSRLLVWIAFLSLVVATV